MRCQVVHLPFGPRCPGPAQLHVRVHPYGWESVAEIVVCPGCAAAAAVIGFFDATVVAAHRLDVPCRHPDGEWDDDGCVLPVTTETPEHVDVGVGVPA